MAIAFDAASGGQGVFVSSFSFSHTCTGSDLRLFMDMSYSLIPGMTVTSVTYNGVAMTVLGSTIAAPAGVKSVKYYLDNPATGAHNITVTTDNAGDVLDCNATSYTGVDVSVAPNLINSNIANGTPTTSTGTTTINNAWTILLGNGGQTAGTGSTKRGTAHGQNGNIYDSNGAITPAGSYSMTTSDVASHAWEMYEFGPLTSTPKQLDATQGQTATLTAAAQFLKTLTATQGQTASLLALSVSAPGVVDVTPIQSVDGLRPMPWRLDLYGVNSLDDLIRRLPELFSNTDIMLQWLFEDLKLVNDALGDGSAQGITSVANDFNIIGTVSGSTLTLGFQGTLPVNRGGSGRTTAIPYSVICGGTVFDGPHQSVVNVGTAGQVLTSNGAAALPTWQAAGGGAARESRKILTGETRTIADTYDRLYVDYLALEGTGLLVVEGDGALAIL